MSWVCQTINWYIRQFRSPVPAQCTNHVHRNWKCFNCEQFILRLKGSQLCLPVDPSKSASELADCYHSVITNILDALQWRRCRFALGPTDLFMMECRQACQLAPRLEWIFRRNKGTGKEFDEYNSWCTALKSSRCLVKWKRWQYRQRSLHSAKLDAKQTWTNLDKLLGNCDPSSCPRPNFSAEYYHKYMEDKINAIRDTHTPLNWWCTSCIQDLLLLHFFCSCDSRSHGHRSVENSHHRGRMQLSFHISSGLAWTNQMYM